MLFPGEFAKINPKSICIKWPSESSRILPLCLKGVDIRLFSLYLYLKRVLPVFHLNNVTDQTITSTALNKLPSSCEKLFRIAISKLLCVNKIKITECYNSCCILV